MKVDLLHTFAWDDINESVTKELGGSLGVGGAFRVYQGLSHAVFETVMGTALFYSHKKHYGFLSGETWAFDAVIPNLLKDGFQSQTVRAGAVDDPKAWVSSLSKETGFVLWAEDHPILGSYHQREDLDQALNAQRIISIRVSHSAFLTRPQEIRPYSVRICSVSPELALVQYGSRFKSPPLFAHRQYWSADRVMSILREGLSFLPENQKQVEDFEKQFDGSAKIAGLSRFDLSGPRIFDRALIFHPEVSSEFLAQSLATGQQRDLAAPGFEKQIEIINRCRWQPAPSFSSWWDPRPRDAVLAGLLILSLEQIANPKILSALLDAVDQGGFSLEPSP